jgi:hypothetical protein
MYWCIIKGGYVIAKIIWDGVTPYEYPYPYDLMVQDVNENVSIGSWYELTENIFYLPLSTPPDFPPEL